MFNEEHMCVTSYHKRTNKDNAYGLEKEKEAGEVCQPNTVEGTLRRGSKTIRVILLRISSGTFTCKREAKTLAPPSVHLRNTLDDRSVRKAGKHTKKSLG